MVKGRILADVMLAKTARWLRLAGIAAMDVPVQGDDQILKVSKRSGAVLLTSDVSLSLRAKKRGIDVLLVDQKRLNGQLAFIIKSLNLKVHTDPADAFCTKCCAKLKTVAPAFALRHGVGNGISARHGSFYYCNHCKKLYWEGTHWDSIRKRLKAVARIAAKSSAL